MAYRPATKEETDAAEFKEQRGRIATAALVGLLACPDIGGDPESLARLAVSYADALMLALETD